MKVLKKDWVKATENLRERQGQREEDEQKKKRQALSSAVVVEKKKNTKTY